MQSLDQAYEREQNRVKPKQAVVNSLADIRTVLKELDPTLTVNKTQDPIEIGAVITVPDERGNLVQKQVTALTKSKSMREHIIDGIKIINNRQAVKSQPHEETEIPINNRAVKPFSPFLDEERIQIDSLIEFWTAGKREGSDIVWRIPEGVFKYDIMEHRLRKCNED